MESFIKSSSSPPHSSQAPRASSRRSKDHPVKTSSPSSPPPPLPASASHSCAADSSPPSSELKFRVSISHNGVYSSQTPASRDACEEKGSRRAPGCEKFKSMESFRERSDDRDRPLDSERENSARSFPRKRSHSDDHHSKCNSSEKSSKSIMKEERDADGMVVPSAARKHARFDKKNGRDGDNRIGRGTSCLQAEPRALHREDPQEAKSASKSMSASDLGAQMDADGVSSKEKKAASVSRLPLKKAFKTLRALNELGNSRDGLLKSPERGSSSGGENTGARKRVSPSKGVEDDGEHNSSPGERSTASIQNFPIKISHISKRARSHRERRSHEKVQGSRGGSQEDSECKPEEASKQEGLLAFKAGEDSDGRVEGEDGSAVSSKGACTKEEEGNLEAKGTLEGREVELDPDGILAFEVDSKEQHASPEGANGASDRSFNVSKSVDADNPVEMLADAANNERMSQGASEMESQGDVHRVQSDEDGGNRDRVCDKKENEVVQDAIGELDRKTHSEVHSADGTVSALIATEIGDSSQRGLTEDYLHEGSMGKDRQAKKISVHEGLDTSKQVTLSLFAKCAKPEGVMVKEDTTTQDLEKEKLLARAHQLQASSIQNGMDDSGNMRDGHSSHGHGDAEFKLGPFQLSLALPGTSNAHTVSHTLKAPTVSHTLNANGAVAPAKSLHSAAHLAHINRHTQTFSQSQAQTQDFSQSQRTYSDDFTNSFSHSFLHNPSCSLDCTSLDNQELSCGGSKQWSQGNSNFLQRSRQTVSANDQNGLVSVSQDMSKHRPGIPLYQNGSMHGFPSASGSNRICDNYDVTQRNRTSEQKFRVESKISQKMEGPARLGVKHKDLSGRSSHEEGAAICVSAARETRSEPLVQRDRERVLHHPASPSRRLSDAKIVDARGDQDIGGGRIGLHEIATEPVAVMAQKMQELPDSFLEGLKGLAKDLIGSFEERDKFLTLQSIIKSRTDLTEHTLLHAQQTQLEIFVAFKTGERDFVRAGAKPLTYKVLTEIFLQTRCRNTNCQQSLPVDGCECKICTEKKGFCHDCMCVVCTKFDSDNQTCRWVGCDVCMHWCHTDCGLRMSYITSARNSRGATGSTEMQYQCVACGHHSELFGFVKEVFHHFADSWGAETLTKELDCVRRIFHGSEDARGKQLCRKVEEMLQKLEKEVDTAEIRRSILQYFTDASANQGTTAGEQSICAKTSEVPNGKAKAIQETAVQVDRSAGNRLADDKVHEALHSYERELLADKINETAELQVGKARKRAELESMVRMKQAEANMLQLRADEAHQEARGLQQIIIVKQEKIEGDYVCKYAKLKLNEAEQKRRKRLMELQALERAYFDYEKMKHRIETQIQDLAIKMEMTNWQYA